MKAVPFPVIEPLATVVRDLFCDAIAWAQLSRLTVDVDGTVLRTRLWVEDAERGFNPHHPRG